MRPSTRAPASTSRTCRRSHPPGRSCSTPPRGAKHTTPRRATAASSPKSSHTSESTMDLPRLSHHLREELIAFTWGQWSQMGLLTTRQERSPWAQDPEALIVFTLEVARGEPRLFDELMDWALLNEPLLSVRRLRAMCIDDTDQMLVTAALEWLASQRPRARLQSGGGTPATATLQPLFRAEGPAGEIEASFAVAGLRRAPLSPSHKSRPPDPTQPINLAFRLRQILGVGIRRPGLV